MLRGPLIALSAVLVAFSPLAGAETLKIATIAPEGSDWMNRMRAGAAEIADKTDGRVEFRFYGSGVQGIGPQLQRKIRIGQLHGGTFTAGGLQLLHKDAIALSMPLVFENQAEVDYVRERIEDDMRQRLEDAGWVNFGFASGGFAYLMTTEPVRTPADLKGLKIWIPEGDEVAYSGVRALGGAPVPLPLTDVLAGLETDLLDSVSVSPSGAVVLQWHTRVRYLTDLPLQYLYAALAISERAFSKLSAGDQAIVREVYERIWSDIDASAETENGEAMAALEAIGIERIRPPADQVPQWRDKVIASNEALVEDGALSRELWQRIEGLLAEFRAGEGNAAP